MALSFLGCTLYGKDEVLKVGDPAPSVISIDQDGNPVDLGEVFASGTTLIYFYPKADTGGCTAQACSLRDAYEVLLEKDVTVIGVSTDSVQDQKAFAEKYHLPFLLLADTDKQVVEAFKVPHARGFAARQAYLIRDGKIIWVDLKASTKKQADDVLAVLNGESTS